jgi:Uma2 family endonuclease
MSVDRSPFDLSDPPQIPKDKLPTMYDLPSEVVGESGLPDLFHIWQAELCSATFCPPTYDSDSIFIASDLNLYYDWQHTSWYKRPDWYAVVGVPRFYEQRDLRMSYVMWQEEVPPFIVIEFLSESTRDEDLGRTTRKGAIPTKWEVYEQIVKIPYYVTFDRLTNELQVFQLENQRYQLQQLTDNKLWIPDLELGLGCWFGNYKGSTRCWLRWYDIDGNWFPTPQEQADLERIRAENERIRAENERIRAESESQRAERLAEYIRKMGINPDEI